MGHGQRIRHPGRDAGLSGERRLREQLQGDQCGAEQAEIWLVDQSETLNRIALCKVTLPGATIYSLPNGLASDSDKYILLIINVFLLHPHGHSYVTPVVKTVLFLYFFVGYQRSIVAGSAVRQSCMTCSAAG